MAKTNRTRALLAWALAVVVLVFVGLAIWQNHDQACERWQREYETILAEAGDGSGVLAFVNLGPLAELEKRQPDGCETPDSGL